MVARLQQAAMIHDQDAVGAADGGKAMGDDHAGAVGQGCGQGLLDQHLGFGVDTGGGLVQHQDAGITGQYPGQGQELALAGGKIEARLADPGLDPLGQPVDQARSTGRWR